MAESYHLLSRQGWTSKVYLRPGEPPRVCKAFEQVKHQKLFSTEKAAYERLTSNAECSGIVRYYGTDENIASALVLEYAITGDLFAYLWHAKNVARKKIEEALLYRWAFQVAKALEFAHSLDVYHSDIHCSNFFLDEHFDVKVGDWAGASIDGSRSHSAYRLTHNLIDTNGNSIVDAKGTSTSTEVFALGSAFYYMVTAEDLWPQLDHDRDRDEIKKRIQTQAFPCTTNLLVLGKIIWSCWHLGYNTMTEVKNAIVEERDAIASIPSHEQKL